MQPGETQPLLPYHMLRSLTADGRLLFATRCARMFAYGMLSVILVLFLTELGYRDRWGTIVSAALLGDIVVSLWMTTTADRVGRRNMLILGALLMAGAGLVFATTDSFPLLLIAATIGVVSPSDKEVGPFLSIEQSALSQTVPGSDRTAIFAWYNLAGSVAAALGTLTAGFAWKGLLRFGLTGTGVYRPIVWAYAGIGILLAAAFVLLSPAAEAPRAAEPSAAPVWLGLHRSRSIILRLSALFALDAFGGGFILQSILVAWFHLRFGADPEVLGSIFFAANLLAAGSALVAARLAERFGLVNTMVFTHLPSNVLLVLVPLMPNLDLAVTLLLVRFSISQMDVPTRQSYTMAVVHPDERSAAAGITTVARSVGAAFSPWLANKCLAVPALLGVPLFIAGGIKIVYDLWLYRAFVSHRPAESADQPREWQAQEIKRQNSNV
jgi:MFS family permease